LYTTYKVEHHALPSLIYLPKGPSPLPISPTPTVTELPPSLTPSVAQQEERSSPRSSEPISTIEIFTNSFRQSSPSLTQTFEFIPHTDVILGTETMFPLLTPSTPRTQSIPETRVPVMSNTVHPPGTDITTDVSADTKFPVLAAAGGGGGAAFTAVMLALIIVVVVIFVRRIKRQRKTPNKNQNEQVMNNPVYSGLCC